MDGWGHFKCRSHFYARRPLTISARAAVQAGDNPASSPETIETTTAVTRSCGVAVNGTKTPSDPTASLPRRSRSVARTPLQVKVGIEDPPAVPRGRARISQVPCFPSSDPPGPGLIARPCPLGEVTARENTIAPSRAPTSRTSPEGDARCLWKLV